MQRRKAQGKSRKAKVKREIEPSLSPTLSASSSAGRLGRPTISIVGAGRLGTALALALAACGFRIDAVVARRASQAMRAAGLAGTQQTRALTIKQLDQLPSSDIILITTPDDAIAATAARLARLTPVDSHRATSRRAEIHETSNRARTLETSNRAQARATSSSRVRTALHSSGALSSDALGPLRAAGFNTGSMHPLISVSDPVTGAAGLSSAFFCIEGEREAVRVARALVRALGARSFSVKTKEKALYHAAAVMSAGHVVALFDIATEMLARCGLSEREARKVLLPLVRSTVENLSAREPSKALTGTFARADAATVSSHLTALRASGLSDALAVYKLLGWRSLRLAKENGADASALDEIVRLLASEEGVNY